MSTSDYTGHVEPNGPASARTVPADGTEVEIRKISVGPMDNNAYLLTDTATGKALLVDAANEADRLLSELGDVDVTAILTTHGHPDHWQALAEVASATGATTYIPPDDADMVPHESDQRAEDGDVISFGEASVRLVHTPGHTPGSTCAVLGGQHLFTGDTLFPGGPGATGGDQAKFTQIMESLRSRLFTLDDATWVYPGHGDDTTLGTERPKLDEWQARGW
jgi:glyoxylase-like metal-dependent hydrolase (beta-lactamase superfamily II)